MGIDVSSLKLCAERRHRRSSPQRPQTPRHANAHPPCKAWAPTTSSLIESPLTALHLQPGRAYYKDPLKASSPWDTSMPICPSRQRLRTSCTQRPKCLERFYAQGYTLVARQNNLLALMLMWTRRSIADGLTHIQAEMTASDHEACIHL